MAAGQYDAAIPIYRELVKALPGETGLVLNLALAQHMAGHEAESIPNFEAVLKVHPGELPALISLGSARLALGQPQRAIAPLEKAAAQDPSNRNARGLLADAYLGANKPDPAADLFRKLTADAPDEPHSWYGLGMSYQAMAGRALDGLQQADPQSPYLAALLAGTRAQRHQFRSAVFFYREALRQLSDVHGIHGALADVYRQTGHPDWAATEDAKERALGPANCQSHAAECQFLAGKDLQILQLSKPNPETLYWQAKAANELTFQAFFRLGQLPASIELHEFRAALARDQGQPLESVKEWRAALEMAPHDPRLEQELATSLFMAGDYRAALEEAQAMLQSAGPTPELNFIAGESLLRMEEPEKSLPYLKAALAADPAFMPANASLGLALSRIGKTGEAIPFLEKALDLDDDGSLHYQLARAYQASGKQEKARATLDVYQKILARNEEAKQEISREAQIEPPQ